MSLKGTFCIKAYCTDHYELPSIHKEFKDMKKLKEWCKDFLQKPNHKVIVHWVHKHFHFGGMRNRPRDVVKKIGVFTKVEELTRLGSVQ